MGISFGYRNSDIRVPISVLALVAALASGCKAEKNAVTILGVDDDGAVVSGSMDQSAYSKNLKELLQTMNDSALPALEQEPSSAGWRVRTVVLGAGVKIEAGLGPIAKASITPVFRLAFSNAKSPTIP